MQGRSCCVFCRHCLKVFEKPILETSVTETWVECSKLGIRKALHSAASPSKCPYYDTPVDTWILDMKR